MITDANNCESVAATQYWAINYYLICFLYNSYKQAAIYNCRLQNALPLGPI